MAQWVEALCSKPEVRGFGYRGCHCNFALTSSFRPHYGIGSASNRNEYQEYFLGGKGVRLTTIPPSFAYCLEIWNPQGLSRSVMSLLLHIFCKKRCSMFGPKHARLKYDTVLLCTSHVRYTQVSKQDVWRNKTSFYNPPLITHPFES